MLICFLTVLWGVLCGMFPETKGKSLEEIDPLWEDKVPAWGKYVPEKIAHRYSGCRWRSRSVHGNHDIIPN
jgi:hypothetical protein